MPAKDDAGVSRRYLWLLWAIAALVARGDRRRWLASHRSELCGWWVLAERGEIAGPRGVEAFRLILQAAMDAIRLRVDPGALRAFTRTPGFLALVGACVLAATAVVSRGFPATCMLIRSLRMVMSGGRGVDASASNLAQLTVIAHTVSLVFGVVVAAAMITAKGYATPWRGWRHAVFFAVKTAGVLALLTVVWMELKALAGCYIVHTGWRILLLSIGSRLLFVVAFGYAAAWSFEDQRWRCPECLRRLAMPAPAGSWSSVYDPAMTELLCEGGHGSLVAYAAAASPPDRWVLLDSSWRDLFRSR